MEEKEYCYPKGIKWTKQRKDVYHVLAESKEPLSATQIYQEILKKEGNVESMTYNNTCVVKQQVNTHR